MSEIAVFWTKSELTAEAYSLPEAWREHVLRPVREEVRRERIAAALLVREVFRGRGLRAEEIALRKDGKPCHPQVCFNLSHSGGRIALAVSEHEVGCDAECLRPVPRVERALFPAERRFLGAAEDRELAFFRLWTRKESYLKWTGEGLKGLSHVEILPGEDAVLRDGAVQTCRFCEYRAEDLLITVCAEEGTFAESAVFLAV